MNKLIFIFVSFLSICTIAVSCMKTDAVAPKENSNSSVVADKTSSNEAHSQYVTYEISPASLVFTDCTTHTLKGNCSTVKYAGGLKAYETETYASQAGIWVRLCNDSIFSKTKTMKIEVHTNSVCGDIAGTGTISPNRNEGQAITNLSLVDATTLYYPVVILPNGKKMYANPITVKSTFHPGSTFSNSASDEAK